MTNFRRAYENCCDLAAAAWKNLEILTAEFDAAPEAEKPEKWEAMNNMEIEYYAARSWAARYKAKLSS